MPLLVVTEIHKLLDIKKVFSIHDRDCKGYCMNKAKNINDKEYLSLLRRAGFLDVFLS